VIYIATPSGEKIRNAMTAGLLACMTTPASRSRIPPFSKWAADNGKYGKGWPGDYKWFRWLSEQALVNDPRLCLLAVAPDEPMNAKETLRISRPWLEPIRALGLPVAFAAQDGCEEPGMIPEWDEFDVLFIAGSTAWKIGPHARQLCQEAKERGLFVHMGRVNSRERLRISQAFGCDSADGTYLAYGPDLLLPKLLSWLDELNGSEELF